MSKCPNESRRGFTLVELAAVVAILATIALIAVTRVERVYRVARRTAAESELKSLCSAFTDPESGYLGDMCGIPGFSVGHLRIANLLMSTNLYGTVAAANGRVQAVRVDVSPSRPGCADAETFTGWSSERGRGWRGPYLRSYEVSSYWGFPAADETRGEHEAPFGARGFYPDLDNLDLADDVLQGLDGCSVYGFPGEAAVNDPWGNPYVLQIPPPQAFKAETPVTDEQRFAYARIVSAGPDGILETPCFSANATNRLATSWNERTRRLARQAGLIDGNDRSARGDDLVLFLTRGDVDEGEERW